MDVKDLIPVVADLREEYLSKDLSMLTNREEASQLSLQSKLAQVVIGVRRSGKSTLCEKFLLEHNVQCAYVNFDEERLADLKNEDLNKLLEAIYFVYGEVEYFFFDEIQNIAVWPLFVNRLLRQGKHLFLTGSNAKLLSNELMTHLTGRHHKVELYPYSFQEYANAKGVDTVSFTTKASSLRKRTLHEYMQYGGFPELLGEDYKRSYIDGLLNAIIRNDISRRFNIRHIDVLMRMANYLADNYAQEFVAKEVASIFGISNHTAENYYSYLKEAFLFIGVQKFSFKSRERLRYEKCYVIDLAFTNERPGTFSSGNWGWKLENVVCIELLRRYRPHYVDIYYYKERSFEVDFVVAKAGLIIELLQVSYDITSDKTQKREIKALLTASNKLNCNNLTLITFDRQEDLEINGKTIHIVSAADWLCKHRLSSNMHMSM